jgi:hypothetical protein
MKASRLSTILFGALFLCSIPTFAGNTINKKSVNINETVTVQGVTLTPGNYKFEWSGPGPDVQLTILHNNDTVATVPAHIVSENISNNDTGYGIEPGTDGGKRLTEVFFSGEKFNLEIGQGANSNGQSSGSASSR